MSYFEFLNDFNKEFDSLSSILVSHFLLDLREAVNDDSQDQTTGRYTRELEFAELVNLDSSTVHHNY